MSASPELTGDDGDVGRRLRAEAATHLTGTGVHEERDLDTADAPEHVDEPFRIVADGPRAFEVGVIYPRVGVVGQSM